MSGNYLVIACETTGIDTKTLDLTRKGTAYYQPIAFGLIVVNEKLEQIDDFYIEIKWDTRSVWDPHAEKIHKLTIERLEKYGIKELAAVEEIGEFIYEHFDTSPLQLIGHNVEMDRQFLNEMFKRYQVQLKFSPVLADLSALGLTFLGTTKRDEIFSIMKCKGKRNALNTARNILTCMKTLQKIVLK